MPAPLFVQVGGRCAFGRWAVDTDTLVGAQGRSTENELRVIEGRERMQATSMRPHKARNAFLAHTGVPLGPLPMSAEAEEPDRATLSLEEARDVELDLGDIVAAYCA